ncbi:hypothetical protein EDB80DRAFT_863051 [Ilyonectria destructans]|nr:hypothetical protein EDB80DRAFT_863051 [Ilyonectria destructans]
MASLTAFVASAKAVMDLGTTGRIRILGTPAEEGGGSKVKLLDAGALSDPGFVAAIMSHPVGGFNLSYMDLRANMSLSKAFSEEMNMLGRKFTICPERGTASTDMGNVSHAVPSFHCTFVLPGAKCANHAPEFTAAAKTPEALGITLGVGKGLGMLGLRSLLDDELCDGARKDFLL